MCLHRHFSITMPASCKGVKRCEKVFEEERTCCHRLLFCVQIVRLALETTTLQHDARPSRGCCWQYFLTHRTPDKLRPTECARFSEIASSSAPKSINQTRALASTQNQTNFLDNCPAILPQGSITVHPSGTAVVAANNPNGKHSIRHACVHFECVCFLAYVAPSFRLCDHWQQGGVHRMFACGTTTGSDTGTRFVCVCA